MKMLKTLGVAVALTAATTLAAQAETTKLRIQTHFSQETLSGQMAKKYIEDITAMSNGEIQIEMFYASSVVKSAETFDAAATGILDCDMTGGAYQTGKNPAFQFTGDLMGGYANPYQQMSWLLHGGGRDAVNELYNQYNMEFVGWWITWSGVPLLDRADPQCRRFQGLEVPFASGPCNQGFHEISVHRRS